MRQSKLSGLEYNFFYHLKKILALLNIYEALMVSQELRDGLIYARQRALSPFEHSF